MVTPTQGAARPSTDKLSLSPIRRRKDRPPREFPELAAGARRFTRGLGRRIGSDGDPYDLPELAAVHDAVDEAMRVAVDGLRRRGWSDRQIGEALGTTRQAVQQHWPRKQDDDNQPAKG